MGFLSGVSSFIEKHSEAVHAVLDVAGFIPVVGAVADIANTALYIHEGDAWNVIMCGIAAIPGIGDLASLARKSYNAFKTSKTGIKVMNALKKYKGVEKILSSLRGKMKTGARGLSKLSEGFGKLFDRIKNLLKGGCMDGRCFTGDTLVLTKHGYTAIKEIQKGDEILSRDEKTGRTGFKEVEDVFIRTVHTIYHVWLDGKEEIKTTAYHPVYVQEQGWVTAINLREGDTLETMEGTACITKIVKERHEEPVTVYNLAVKDWVSYFVGNVRVYVHNGDGYKSNIIQTINNKFPNDNQIGKNFNYTIDNGRIYTDNGIQNVDFVIDINNNLHIGRGHSYLSAGDPVQAAGTMKINSQGYIRLITNESGHFQPTKTQALNYPAVFKNAGLNIKNTWIKIMEFQTSKSNYVINSKVLYNGLIKNMH